MLFYFVKINPLMARFLKDSLEQAHSFRRHVVRRFVELTPGDLLFNLLFRRPCMHLERLLPREQMVKHHPQCPHVNYLICVAGVSGHLGALVKLVPDHVVVRFLFSCVL